MKFPQSLHRRLNGSIIRTLVWRSSLRPSFRRGILDGSKSGGMYLFSTFRSPILAPAQSPQAAAGPEQG